MTVVNLEVVCGRTQGSEHRVEKYRVGGEGEFQTCVWVDVMLFLAGKGGNQKHRKYGD